MNLEYIIPQVVETLLTPVVEDGTSSSGYPSLCYSHEDPMVRAIIHSMLRMAACTSSRSHVISPCYRSTGPVECRNYFCPYVIGHSIYLWVAMKTETKHRGEEFGVGCTFKHEGIVASVVESARTDQGTSSDGEISRGRREAVELNKHAYEIRQTVFEYMDKTYGEIHLFRLPPLLAMNHVRNYYENIIRVLLQRGRLSETEIPSRDLTSGKVGFAKIYKSDDTIFAVKVAVGQQKPGDAAQLDPRMRSAEGASDVKLFPALTSLGDQVVPRKSLYRKKGDDI